MQALEGLIEQVRYSNKLRVDKLRMTKVRAHKYF